MEGETGTKDRNTNNNNTTRPDKLYRWKCDGCHDIITSDSPCPKEFEVAPFTEDYSCKNCKSGILFRLITWEEYITMNRSHSKSEQTSNNKQSSNNKQTLNVRSTLDFDRVCMNYKTKNIGDLLSLINEGDPAIIEIIVNGLTAESKKLFLERLQKEKL